MNQTISSMLAGHRLALAEFEKNMIGPTIKTAEMICDCFKNGNRLYLCGNGGSAADCQHIAGELVGRFRRQRKALPATALTTDSSVLTCLGNDCGFENVFSRQVEAQVKCGDILWAFSTSGNSENIILAAKQARRLKAAVIAFTGKKGSPLESMADVCLCTQCQNTSTSQEIHQLAYHIICAMVEENIAAET